MLNGNKDNMEKTAYRRGGPLAKQVIRGTAWRFTLHGRATVSLNPNPPQPPPTPPPGQDQGGGGGSNDEADMWKEITQILQGSQGTGFKASVGSREVRGEWIVWYKDSEAASNMVKKWKERDWVKDDEKEPPRWWKTMANKSGGGKTAPNIVKDNLSFRSSGETFTIRSSMETKLVGVGGLVSAVTGGSGGGGFGPPGGGMPGPPGGGGRPGGRRRRFR